MKRAIIDTNILVSGLLGGKRTLPIIEALIDKKFRLVISNQQIKELLDVIRRPKFRSIIDEKDAIELFLLIQLEAEIIQPTQKVKDCRDPKDNFILECALESSPDYIVTGDDDLLILHPYKRIQIISAAKFLKEILK